jgi:hypothetical protein
MKPITPATKVAELLEQWPDLEPVLVAQAPAFQKLRNPVLRRTIARVATLEQAAGIAGIEPRELVMTLRRAAGQPVDDLAAARPPAATPARGAACGMAGAAATAHPTTGASPPIDVAPPTPAGTARAPAADGPRRVVDADALLAAGEVPLKAIFDTAMALECGEQLEVLVSFRPVPLLDRLEDHGFRCDVGRSDDGRVLVLVSRHDDAATRR